MFSLITVTQTTKVPMALPKEEEGNMVYALRIARGLVSTEEVQMVILVKDGRPVKSILAEEK